MKITSNLVDVMPISNKLETGQRFMTTEAQIRRITMLMMFVEDPKKLDSKNQPKQ